MPYWYTLIVQNSRSLAGLYTPAHGYATGGQRRIFRKVAPLRKKQRLTREQEEIRLRGLRILARMIVRAHLDGTAGEGQESGGVQDTTGPASDVPGKDGEHVR